MCPHDTHTLRTSLTPWLCGYRRRTPVHTVQGFAREVGRQRQSSNDLHAQNKEFVWERGASIFVHPLRGRQDPVGRGLGVFTNSCATRTLPANKFRFGHVRPGGAGRERQRGHGRLHPFLKLHWRGGSSFEEPTLEQLRTFPRVGSGGISYLQLSRSMLSLRRVPAKSQSVRSFGNLKRKQDES